MSETELGPVRPALLRPVELSSWALVVFGMFVIWWLPISPDNQHLLFIALLAFALYILAYFHWMQSHLQMYAWVNVVPTVANIAMATGVNYMVGTLVNAELIYIIIIVNAAVRLGRRLAIGVALLSGASVLLVETVRSGLSPRSLVSIGLTVIIYIIAAYLAGSLTRTIHRQLERAAVINEVARATSTTIEMDALLGLIYQQLSRVIPTETYYVGLHELHSDSLDMLIVFDEGVHFPAKKIRFGEGLASYVILQRKPLLIRRLSLERGRLPITPLVVGHDRMSESWLGVPMRMADDFEGVLVVASYKPDAFDENDVVLMTNIAGQVALALDNARHHAQVEEQARRDSLTGVFNHGHLLKRLYEAVDQCRLSGNKVSMIMLDIDHFKKYNDTYGHVMGDQVLRLIVQAIQAHVKQTDAVGRWGGEEFAILLPSSTVEQTSRVANRVRETLAELPLVDGSGNPIPKPTVSQGIATFPDHVASANALVDLADQMLYLAKRQGRDKVRAAVAFEVKQPK